jgi:hypothetical protein
MMDRSYVTTEFRWSEDENWMWIYFHLHASNAPDNQCYDGGYNLGGIQVRREDWPAIKDDLKSLGWFGEDMIPSSHNSSLNGCH